MIIGIDPGSSGGVAFIFENGEVEAFKMPDTERDILDLLSSTGDEKPVVFLEKVHTMKGQGIASSGKFMQGYGLLRGIVTALKYPLYDVTPQKWQKALSCLSGGNKNVTKQAAQQLFPQLKITHATADSLLLAYYGKLFMEGRLK